MRADDLILVSVDDHVIEPIDMFEGRMPRRLQDRAPHVERKADGTQTWVFDDREQPQIGLNAVAGRPPEEYGIEPLSFEEMRPGTYDVDERIADMNANGQLGGLCFPSFPRFCGQLFAGVADKELAAATVRAYNDWHLESWAGAHPDRLIPLAMPMLWDAELTAAEMRRVTAKGCHALSFSENPSKLGLPSLHNSYWDPLWQVCNDEEIRVCMHIGSSSQIPITAPDAPIDVSFVLTTVQITHTATDLVWSPILQKFPDIKFVLSEGGIGWVPFLLERMDYVYEHHKAWTGHDLGGRLPSEVFHERLVTCFVDDAFGLSVRERLNLDQVAWECDFPHSDSTWPNAPELLEKRFDDMPDPVVNKITHENAMRLFHFDPSSSRRREDCTVGALRALAAGRDLTFRAPVRKASRPATGGSMLGTSPPAAEATGGARASEVGE